MARQLHQSRNGPGWQLLTWLAEAAFLTADLAAIRFYRTPAGPRTATYRFDELREWGLVSRRFLRHTRQAWHLSELGVRLMSDYLDLRPADIGAGGAEPRMGEGFVKHRLAVTAFEAALRLHADTHGGRVLRFQREPRIEVKSAGTNETVVIRPDAAVIYEQGNRTWNLAVEIDRDTERPAEFVTKVPRYEAITRGVGREWRLVWDDIPTCLIVAAAVGGPDRAARLKAEIDALPVDPNPDNKPERQSYRLFKLVAAEDLYSMPASVKGALPDVVTRFHEAVCLAARKPQHERWAVFK